MNILLDSNIWNFLYENKIWLPDHFSQQKYNFFITKELDFEIDPIPISKSGLKEFIYKTIEAANIRIDTIFGFNNNSLPDSEQRIGGFDQGRFMSDEESKFSSLLRGYLGNKKKKSKLYNNEADISIAVRSCRAVVLTLDAKEGPLSEAKRQGGNVVYLNDFKKGNQTIENFILQYIDH